jgi:DNA primase
MSFLPEFLDEIRLRVLLSDSIAKRVPLTRKGREFAGLCPFHKEKTPSFTVNDEKGFFHCFGCGAHGDVIGFEMRMDGLSFPEAVERLAGVAGLALPKQTPEDRERAKKRTSLYEVMEAACVWFEGRLADVGGKRGADYLAERGLEAEIIAKFRLGWAPESRSALKEAMAAQGISEAMMAEAGLTGTPDDGGKPYDRFRGRIIFPIADRGGRVIAFGGRALGDGMPKYLNSPETPLFHKGRLLYGLALARKPAHDAGEVIVAEGYMDVIALHRAGFQHAVAPLGTALTEDQMRELWRLAPEPIVCFDGDDAGQRAAMRAAERVLPLLESGRSLRFAYLPSGEDPDSLLAAKGGAEFSKLLKRAKPLSEVLWAMEFTGRPIDTPERRAGVEKKLYDLVGKIGDQRVRDHYRREMKSRFWAAFSGGGPAHKSARPSARGAPLPRTSNRGASYYRLPEPPLSDALGSGGEGSAERRERLLVTMVLAHPELLANLREDFAAVEIARDGLDKLRKAILDASVEISDLDSETLKRHLSDQGFAKIIGQLMEPQEWSRRRLSDPVEKPGASLSRLEGEWREVCSRHMSSFPDDMKEAEVVMGEDLNDETLAMFVAISKQRETIVGEDAELEPALP